MNITSKQRAALKKLAHDIEPVVRIGKGEVDDDIFESVRNVIVKRELIKVKVLQNSSLEDMRGHGEKLKKKNKNILEEKKSRIIIL